MSNSWTQSGSNLPYTFIDQDFNGQIIAASYGGTIYVTINGGTSWSNTVVSATENITGLSVGLNINYAYCCTPTKIYSCTNINTSNSWVWTDVTTIGGFPTGRTYNSIVLGDRLNQNGVYYIILGTSNGIYNTTPTSTNGTRVTINNAGDTTFNWSYVSIAKEYVSGLANFFVGVSGNKIYLGRTNSQIALTVGTDPDQVSPFNNVLFADIYQTSGSTQGGYEIYLITSITGDTIYNGTYDEIIGNNPINSILPLAGTSAPSGVSWSFISCVGSLAVAACQDGGLIYTSTDGATNFTSRENTNNWSKVVTSPSGQYIIASTTNSDPVFSSTDGGVSCIYEGTRILTTNGEVEIQDLNVNDEIITTEGIKKIKYIGDLSINALKHPDKVFVIKKDLYLTSGHSVLFEKGEHDKYKNEKYNDEFYKKIVNNIHIYKKIITKDCNIAYSPNISEYSDKLVDNHFKYYHIVLENDYFHKQYAIYTNGMLSETASENYFIKYSNLKMKI